MHLGNGRNQVVCHLCKRVELRAKVCSVEERQNGYCTHFRNWAYSVHHPLDSTDSPFPFILSVNWLPTLIGATESNLCLLCGRRLGLVMYRSPRLDGKGIWRGEKRFGSGGLNGSPGGRDGRRLSSFFGGSVVPFGRYFGGVAGNDRRGHVR